MDFATFSSFKRKDRKVERKKKEERDIYVGDCLLGNIADPYKFVWTLAIKTLLYLKCPLVSKFIRCVVCLSSCLLLHVPFQLHFRLNLFSLNVLFAF